MDSKQGETGPIKTHLGGCCSDPDKRAGHFELPSIVKRDVEKGLHLTKFQAVRSYDCLGEAVGLST